MTGNPVRDFLAASFNVDAFGTETATFHHNGDSVDFRFGTATLTEDYIAGRPVADPGASDPNLARYTSTPGADPGPFSYEVDPSHPEELNIGVDVRIPGTSTTLHFTATPTVVSGPSLQLIQGDAGSPEYPLVQNLVRGDPAPTGLPGSTRDTAPDFTAHFNEQGFDYGGHHFKASIDDIVFAQPNVPASEATANNPQDVEAVTLKITLDDPTGSASGCDHARGWVDHDLLA